MKTYLLALIAFVPALAPAAPTTRPNVLFIISDDLNNHLGCYGDKVVKTPNIDALAQRGVRFDRAYCQYPVCNPSRTSFLSGLYPDRTGVIDQATLLRKDKMPGVIYLPEHFKSNGYFTAGIGKVEHGGHHEIKWDLADDIKAGAAGDDDNERPLRAGRRTPTKRQDMLTYEVKRATEEGDAENLDDQIAARTVKLLEEHKDGPFFIAVGFHKPHVPHVAPKRFFDLYPPEKMPLTEVIEGDEKDIPKAALASQRNFQPDMSPERQRDIIAAYYACTSYMDAKLGEVTGAMDRLKLWDSTIVVFIGDHGWGFGEHGWWAKASLFEPSARAPMIMVLPGAAGAVCPRVVEFADLYPTLCDLCHLPKPPQSQGRSITPLLNDPQQPWDGVALTALGARGRTIRDERFRYTEWDQGKAGVELYDHDNDPNEFTNLADDPAHAQTVARMKQLLAAKRSSLSQQD